jgi:hypothetical protein
MVLLQISEPLTSMNEMSMNQHHSTNLMSVLFLVITTIFFSPLIFNLLSVLPHCILHITGFGISKYKTQKSFAEHNSMQENTSMFKILE